MERGLSRNPETLALTQTAVTLNRYTSPDLGVLAPPIKWVLEMKVSKVAPSSGAWGPLQFSQPPPTVGWAQACPCSARPTPVSHLAPTGP